MKPLLEKDAYTVNLEINNKEYVIDVKNLLHLESAIEEEASSLELEMDLEKIAGYLHTFLTAFRDKTIKKKRYALDYEIWYTEKLVKAEEYLTSKFIKEFESGSRSKTKVTPTKIQIENQVIIDNTEEYRKRNNKMNVLESACIFLDKEFKLLQERASHIQSLLSMRRQVMSKEISL